MSNPYFNPSGVPANRASGSSATIRAEFALAGAGFDKLPTLSGNASKVVQINGAGTAMEATSAINSVTIGLTSPAEGRFTILGIGKASTRGKLDIDLTDAGVTQGVYSITSPASVVPGGLGAGLAVAWGNVHVGLRVVHGGDTNNAEIALMVAAGGSTVTGLIVKKEKTVHVQEAASTPSAPSSGGIFYVQSGALKYIGSSGTVTTLAPA